MNAQILEGEFATIIRSDFSILGTNECSVDKLPIKNRSHSDTHTNLPLLSEDMVYFVSIVSAVIIHNSEFPFKLSVVYFLQGGLISISSTYLCLSPTIFPLLPSHVSQAIIIVWKMLHSSKFHKHNTVERKTR